MKFRGNTLKEGYIFATIFLFVLVVGIVAKWYFPKVWDWFGAIDTASAVALAFLALLGYVEYIRGEDEVEIVFDVEGKLEPTGLTILRKNFTRSEVLGVLGMIPTNQKDRFELTYTKERAFLDEIHKIQKGKAKKFFIKMTSQERSQFDL